MKSISTFLMFSGEQHGRAQEAMELYVSLFAGATIDKLELFGAGEHGTEGTVRAGSFSMNGQRFMVFDSVVPHAFGFTPAVSLFVECEDAAELDRVYAALVEGGGALMPAGNYGFSERFGWVNDRFGVSWQLNFGGVQPAT